MGQNCDQNVNDCAVDPCLNGASCIDQIDGFSCQCQPGFDGSRCEININECLSNPCVHGDCQDGINGYTCRCPPQFMGQNCDQDYDPCVNNTCQNGGVCIRSEDNRYLTYNSPSRQRNPSSGF